jgi:hypothetical protein
VGPIIYCSKGDMLAIDNIYKNNFTNMLKNMVLMWEG